MLKGTPDSPLRGAAVEQCRLKYKSTRLFRDSLWLQFPEDPAVVVLVRRCALKCIKPLLIETCMPTEGECI